MLRHLGRLIDVGVKVGTSLLHLKEEDYAPVLKKTLGELKGPLLKMGQFLATIPDAIPESYARELLTLQSKAPPMSEGKVRRRLEAELGLQWEKLFQEFSIEPFAAASLGQVHKARLLDGQNVACKIQYPHMHTYIEADLQQLDWVLSLYKRFYGAIDPQPILKEMRERLFEELDYHHEARMMELFRSYGIVPRIVPEFSKSGILTMEMMDGHDFLNYSSHKDQIWKNNLAQNLFTMWYKPFYQEGLLHADPHPGNYLVTEDGQIQWLDFGCVRQFPASFVQGVHALYEGLERDDRDQRIYAYELWGFPHLTQEMEEAITLWAQLLFDPLLDDRIRPIQPDFSGKTGWQVAQNVHEALRKAGGLTPPQTFVFMDRVAVGLGGVFMHLKAEVNWHKLYQDLRDSMESRI